jgi:flagellar hook-basal body complex protein FliE
MVQNLNPIHESRIPEGVKLPQNQNPKGPAFAEVLKESLDQVNALQAQKTEKIEDLVTGKANSIEEVMIAVEEANLAFEMTMQVRNKLVEAYNELLRMQV